MTDSREPRLAYIALGSNLGDRAANIRAALAALAGLPGLQLCRASQLLESKPQGFESANHFLNGVVEIKWLGEPLALLQALKKIEADLGREPLPPEAETDGPTYRDRPIDLDIVWMEGIELESPELTIPHPRAHARDFVLQPLAELNPPLALQLATPGREHPIPD